MTEMIKMILNARSDAINCDFEYAAFAAMKDCFPDAEIRGCLFHLSQNLLKQLKSMGLYNSNPEFALYTKMVTALSFVPCDDICRHVDDLAAALPVELVLLLN